MKSAIIGTVAALLVVIALGCGLFSPAVVPPTIDCTTRIINDADAGMTIEQILVDVAGPCSADIATIIAVLLASKSDAVHASKAYAQVISIRMQVVDGGAQ